MGDKSKNFNINKFLNDDDTSPVPCPHCGSKVEITNSRDCELLSTYARCQNEDCEGEYFYTESNAFLMQPAEFYYSDIQIVAIKYYYWAKSVRAKKGYRCLNEWD